MPTMEQYSLLCSCKYENCCQSNIDRYVHQKSLIKSDLLVYLKAIAISCCHSSALNYINLLKYEKFSYVRKTITYCVIMQTGRKVITILKKYLFTNLRHGIVPIDTWKLSLIITELSTLA